MAASASSSSFGHKVRRWPTKPGRNDGKHTEAQTPLRSMSPRRALASQAPLRMWSKRLGSKVCSRRGRPATALKPTFGSSWSVHSQAWPPLSVSTTRGATSAKRAGKRPSKMSGGSTTWSSTDTIVAHTSGGSGSGRKVTVPGPCRPKSPVRFCRSSTEIPMGGLLWVLPMVREVRPDQSSTSGSVRNSVDTDTRRARQYVHMIYPPGSIVFNTRHAFCT